MNFQKILIKTSGKTSVIYCPDIKYCRADGAYTEIVLGNDECFIISKTLKRTMEIISAAYLVRISQSVSLNMEYIKYIHHKQKIIELNTGERFRFTTKRIELERVLSKNDKFTPTDEQSE